MKTQKHDLSYYLTARKNAHDLGVQITGRDAKGDPEHFQHLRDSLEFAIENSQELSPMSIEIASVRAGDEGTDWMEVSVGGNTNIAALSELVDAEDKDYQIPSVHHGRMTIKDAKLRALRANQSRPVSRFQALYRAMEVAETEDTKELASLSGIPANQVSTLKSNLRNLPKKVLESVLSDSVKDSHALQISRWNSKAKNCEVTGFEYKAANKRAKVIQDALTHFADSDKKASEFEFPAIPKKADEVASDASTGDAGDASTGDAGDASTGDAAKPGRPEGSASTGVTNGKDKSPANQPTTTKAFIAYLPSDKQAEVSVKIAIDTAKANPSHYIVHSMVVQGLIETLVDACGGSVSRQQIVDNLASIVDSAGMSDHALEEIVRAHKGNAKKKSA